MRGPVAVAARGLATLAGVAAAQQPGAPSGPAATATPDTRRATALQAEPEALPSGSGRSADAARLPGDQAATGGPAAGDQGNQSPPPATPNDTSATNASTMNGEQGNGRPGTTADAARPAPSAEGPASGSLADGFHSYRPPDAASRTSTVDGYSAKGLMGSSLLGPDGERVAKVADLVFGPDGTVKRLVVEVGGFLGIGARRVAIDVDQLQRLPDGRGDDLRTTLTRSQLEALPRYRGDEG